MRSKKIKVAIFSTTRAEFGIMSPLIKEIQNNRRFTSYFFVGGSHTSRSYGETISEIRKSKIKITKSFKYPTSRDERHFIANAMAISMKKLSIFFKKYDFDIIIVLGDRYELIPVILNSILYNKLIVHIGGGEATQGLIDEQVRNMISKAAHIHFTTTKKYAIKLLEIGEHRKRIFNVGSLSIDGILRVRKKSKIQIYNKYGFNKNLPIVILTYHPVTLEFGISPSKQIESCFDALAEFQINLIVTSPNIEVGSKIIKKIIMRNVRKNKNYHYFDSLGFENYHQLLQHSKFVIGNSSSGIVEVPYYKIPTINIGIRQKKRLRHLSIIDVNYDSAAIIKGIKKANSIKFNKQLKKMIFQFGNGQAVKKIINKLEKYRLMKDIFLK